MAAPGPKLDEAKAIVDAAALEAGRDPATIGMEGRAIWVHDGLQTLLDDVERWRSAGATHLSINTMGAGLTSVDEHLAVLAGTADALSLPRA